MTDIERARKASALVDTMAQSFDELLNEYWHEDLTIGHGWKQLRLEIEQAQRIAFMNLKSAEESALDSPLLSTEKGLLDND